MSHHWKNLQIVADAANPNNRRITADNDRHVCKVYGYDPDQAQAKAEIILAALSAGEQVGTKPKA